MMEKGKSLNGTGTITSLSQMLKIGPILSNIQQELKDGIVLVPTQSYFIPRTIPIKLLLKRLDELTDSIPGSSIYITITSNHEAVLTLLSPKHLTKSVSSMKLVGLNGD